MYKMGNRLSFYGSQSMIHIKKATLVILGLSIGVSLICGVNFYADSYTENVKVSLQNQFNDFYFKVDFNEETMPSLEQRIEEQLIQRKAFRIEDIYSSAYMKSPYLFIRNTTLNARTNVNETIYPISENAIQNWNLNLFSNEYYQSDYFTRLFQITNGSYPENENEIMVDSELASKMDWYPGLSTNITLGYSSSQMAISLDLNSVESHSTNLTVVPDMVEIKIVGIYHAKSQEIWLGQDFYYNWNYRVDTENADTLAELNQTTYLNTPIFGMFNLTTFFEGNFFTPYFQSIGYIDEDATSALTNFGFMAFYDLESIQLLRINKEIAFFQEEIESINYELPNTLRLTSLLTDRLLEIKEGISFVEYGLQLLNLPLILFILLISVFSFKSDIHNRLESLLLLRMKGAPDKILIQNLIMESVIMGVIVGILGNLFGCAVFSLINYSVKNLLLATPYANFHIIILPITVIMNLGIGILLLLISSFISLFFITQLSSSKIIALLGVNQVDSVLTDQDLFPKKQKTKEGKIKDAVTKREDRNEGESNEKMVVTAETKRDSGNKRVKFGIYLMLFSGFPFIIYLISEYAKSNPVSDGIQGMLNLIQTNLDLFLVIYLFSPIILLVGIIRFFYIEHPKFYGKLTYFLGKITHPSSAKIFTLNALNKRIFPRIIMIFGIVIASFTVSNIALNSLVRYNAINENLLVGGDMQLNFKTIQFVSDWDYTGLVNNYRVQNLEDFQIMEEEIENLSVNNLSVVDEVVTIYHIIHVDRIHPCVMFFNFSAYLQTITDTDKFQPSQNLIETFNSTINYNANLKNDSFPAILCNQKLLDVFQHDEMDTFSIFNRVYSKSENTLILSTNSGILYDVLDFLPGYSVEEFDYPFVIIDLSLYKTGNQTLPGWIIRQIYDFSDNSQAYSEESQALLLNTVKKYEIPISTEYYNHNWNVVNLNINQISSQIYSVFNMEFYTLGVVLSIGLAIMFIDIQKRERYNNGVLLARGMGKKKIYSMVLTELGHIFIHASLVGIICGLVFVFPILQLSNSITFPNFREANLPIYWNFPQLALFLGCLPVMSFILFNISYMFEVKRDITSYLHKF